MFDDWAVERWAYLVAIESLTASIGFVTTAVF